MPEEPVRACLAERYPAEYATQHNYTLLSFFFYPEIADYNDSASMFSGRVAFELAVIAVLCVVSLFLFPAAHGSYTAVHGPVSALQSFRAAIRLRLAIVAAAYMFWAGRFNPATRFSGFALESFQLATDSDSLDLSTILRC
jgi:hypothetical protein